MIFSKIEVAITIEFLDDLSFSKRILIKPISFKIVDHVF